MTRRRRLTSEWFAELGRIVRERFNLTDDWKLARTAWVGDTGEDGMDVTLRSQSGKITARLTQAECDQANWEEMP